MCFQLAYKLVGQDANFNNLDQRYDEKLFECDCSSPCAASIHVLQLGSPCHICMLKEQVLAHGFCVLLMMHLCSHHHVYEPLSQITCMNQMPTLPGGRARGLIA